MEGNDLLYFLVSDLSYEP